MKSLARYAFGLVVLCSACAPQASTDPPAPATGTGGSPSEGGDGGQAGGDTAHDGGHPAHHEEGGGGSATEPTRLVMLIPGTTITGDYFDVMAERLSADGYLPVVFEPPDLFTDSLSIGAERIAAAVDDALATSGEHRLDIVAECNGGVATRYFLQVLGGDDRIDQVVTFVSAHHGTWLSPVGDGVTGYPSLADITPGSPFLAELDAAPFPAGLALTSIYSCNDELMVPYDTSVVDGATNVLFCDHYIGHFDGFWDSMVYERIRLTLAGLGASAPTQY